MEIDTTIVPKKAKDGLTVDVHSHLGGIGGAVAHMCPGIPTIINFYIGFYEDENGKPYTRVGTVVNVDGKHYRFSNLMNQGDESQKAEMEDLLNTIIVPAVKNVAEEFTHRQMWLPNEIHVTYSHNGVNYCLIYDTDSPDGSDVGDITREWDSNMARSEASGMLFGAGMPAVFMPVKSEW